ncbi:hypothetical protein HanPI659440_Chr16g0657731 [Helianthus annuus]|nr:hypothetical protein HanPI659440_Chr16g0657731 [Helianthus annuus]
MGARKDMGKTFSKLTQEGVDSFYHQWGIDPSVNQVDVCLISSLVSTLGSWKEQFFWVSESVVPFKMVWRHPDAVLNELDPSESELNEGMLKALRACPSQLRPFPEHLLVFTGVSVLWDRPNRDPSFTRGGQVMSALDFIKSDDTSDVVLGDTEAIEDEDAIARTAEGRLVPGSSM